MAIYEVTIDLTGWLGGPGTNTLFFDGKGELGGSASQAKADAAASLADTFATNIRGLLSTIVTAQVRSSVTAREPTTGVPIQQFTVSELPHTGLSLGDLLPPMSCLVIGWRSTTPTRSGRGRTFVGPGTEALSEPNGTPLASAIVTGQTAADQLITDSQADVNAELVVWHRPTPLDPTGGIRRPVVLARIRDKWGSLRSRRD
jgi:hypothetical protein